MSQEMRPLGFNDVQPLQWRDIVMFTSQNNHYNYDIVEKAMIIV